jgi:hypothetical protein
MLPGDTKKRKTIDKQPSVTEHFGPEDRDAKTIPYSDKSLETASLEWMVQTNQVCHLLDRLLFPKLILINIVAASYVQ